MKNIILGFSRFYADKLNMVSKPIALESKRRIEICKGCELLTDNFCDSKKHSIYEGHKTFGCGCFVEPKSFTDSKCPLRKW